jgi:hypothetical protein
LNNTGPVTATVGCRSVKVMLIGCPGMARAPGTMNTSRSKIDAFETLPGTPGSVRLRRVWRVRISFASSMIKSFASLRKTDLRWDWHVDGDYWGTCSSEELLTGWIPFHDCPEELGPLAVIKMGAWPLLPMPSCPPARQRSGSTATDAPRVPRAGCQQLVRLSKESGKARIQTAPRKSTATRPRISRNSVQVVRATITTVTVASILREGRNAS